jgi:hypothetical protein
MRKAIFDDAMLMIRLMAGRGRQMADEDELAMSRF